MKISTARFLEIIRDTLQDVVAPELTTDGTRRSLAIACAGLDELMKRETVTPETLGRLLAGGAALASELEIAAANAGLDVPTALRAQLADVERRVQEAPPGSVRLELYREIVSRLEDLARVLARTDADGKVPARELSLIGRAAEWENAFEQAQLRPLECGVRAVESAAPLTREKLQEFLRTTLQDEQDVTVRGFRLMPAGMVHETFEFLLDSDRRSGEEMIVRKTKGEPFARINCFELHREFDLVQALHRSGYLLPEALWLTRSLPDVTGEFYVMRRAHGSKNADLFSTGSPIPRGVLLGMAEQLGRLHALPLDAFSEFIELHARGSLRNETASEASRRNLEDWYDAWLTFRRQASPAEVYLLSWLRSNLPPNNRVPSLVHSDFTPHNCLWDGDRLSAVLDWEGAHFGDPAEDIAYIKPHIAARMNWDEWLSHYQAYGGMPVDAARIAYYTCYVHMRTVILANKIATGTQLGGNSDIISLQIDQEYLPRTLQMCLASIREHDAGRELSRSA